MPLKLSKTVFGMKAAVKIRRQQAEIGHLILSLQEASDSFYHAVSLQEQKIKLKMESCCHICVGATQTSLFSFEFKIIYTVLWEITYFSLCNALSINCGERVLVQIQKRP